MILVINDRLSSDLQHLKKRHKVDKDRQKIENSQASQLIIASAFEVAAIIIATVSNLITCFNILTFCYLFICWIVTMHIALMCVESDTFWAWVLYIASALDKYLVELNDFIYR